MKKLKVISLNIQGGCKINPLKESIKAGLAPFDLMALQEVCEGKTLENHARQIADTLGHAYRYSSNNLILLAPTASVMSRLLCR